MVHIYSKSNVLGKFCTNNERITVTKITIKITVTTVSVIVTVTITVTVTVIANEFNINRQLNKTKTMATAYDRQVTKLLLISFFSYFDSFNVDKDSQSNDK